MIKARLVDGAGTGRAATVKKRNGHAGLVVLTDPLRELGARLNPFANPDNGTNLAVSVSFGGTPEEIYDGNDNTYWTGSAISGTDWSDSTVQANSGAASLRFNSGSVGDTFQFDKGSNLATSGYTAITFAIRVNRRWASDPAESVELYGWDTGTASEVGTRVKIENYFTPNSFDVWQQVAIPLSDMGLTAQALDAFRLELVGVVNTAPDFFIDDLQLEETGAGIRYTSSAVPGTIFFAREIRLTLVDALPATVNNGTAPGLSYNQILALPALSFGLAIRQYKDEKVTFVATFNQLSDFLFAGFNIENVVSDGTNTLLVLSATFANEQRMEARDRFEIEVLDDLSGLLEFRATLRGAEETI